MNNNQEIAILFFSRSARQEATRKKWTCAPALDYHIANHLINRTKEQLLKAPFDVFHVDERMQKGKSFGARFSHAFQLVFEKGYQYVIAVGNDCPDIQINWSLIQKNLRSGKTVLGPNHRGGVYLLGLASNQDYKNIFKSISWNSSQVLNQLTGLLDDIIILEARRDINTFEDILVDPGLRAIFASSGSKIIDKSGEVPFILNHLLTQKPLRAPPKFSF